QADQRRAGALTMNFASLDLSTVGLVLASLTGVGSFVLGRYLRRKRQEKRAARERIAEEATQSRQVRRAKERRR
ncbi:MAG TPA: hypothetical protein VMR43_05445, partial [Variovorax sp.]|nr:hypothetical protein [Variovorax sp.]